MFVRSATFDAFFQRSVREKAARQRRTDRRVERSIKQKRNGTSGATTRVAFESTIADGGEEERHVDSLPSDRTISAEFRNFTIEKQTG